MDRTALIDEQLRALVTTLAEEEDEYAVLSLALIEDPKDQDTIEALEACDQRRKATAERIELFKAARKQAERADAESERLALVSGALDAANLANELAGKRAENAREIDRAFAKLGELLERDATLARELESAAHDVLNRTADDFERAERSKGYNSRRTTRWAAVRDSISNIMPFGLAFAATRCGLIKAAKPNISVTSYAGIIKSQPTVQDTAEAAAKNIRQRLNEWLQRITPETQP